jgi:hypothetical protein
MRSVRSEWELLYRKSVGAFGELLGARESAFNIAISVYDDMEYRSVQGTSRYDKFGELLPNHVVLRHHHLRVGGVANL